MQEKLKLLPLMDSTKDSICLGLAIAICLAVGNLERIEIQERENGFLRAVERYSGKIKERRAKT
ncbi:hypothetical protein AGMMS49531_10400 [Endomicrobiia bacterium]|nr:hypothetical protein AGMMS49531_10400 [Endomicrobiia bacterium]